MTPVVKATFATIFERGPRFIAHAKCPKCTSEQVGVTYHGTLLDGRKIYQLAAHSPGRRAVKNKEGRCDGSDARMQVTTEGWRPAP